MRASYITAALTAAVTLTTVGAAHAATTSVSGGGAALQTAINSASAGDVLRVAPGMYSPISTDNKRIIIESTGAVCGTVTVSAKMAVNKKTGVTNWTYTAKVLLQAATVSFSGAEWPLHSKTGEKLELQSLGADTFCGTYHSTSGAAFSAGGSRNAFSDRKEADAARRLTPLKGLYMWQWLVARGQWSVG